MIYHMIKGCYRKLFLEHSGLNYTRVTAINISTVYVHAKGGLSCFLGVVKTYLGGVWQHELASGRGEEAAPAR